MNAKRWVPSTEAALLKAIEDGIFDEGHFFEAKSSVGDTKGERKETARDLASFAVDGGIFIIGVHEDKVNKRWDPEPVDLSGYAERVEQVAFNLVDPPLILRITEIPAAGKPGHGYLAVEVSASLEAPHMVDGVYYQRGEKTRVRLGDAQVRRFHAARADQEAVIDRLLDEEIARDPVAPADRSSGHLYLVAHPVDAPRDVVHDIVYGDNDVLWWLVDHGEREVPHAIRGVRPSAVTATSPSRRADGYARCSESLSGGRIFQPMSDASEILMADIEFRVSGQIRVLVGGLSRPLGRGDDSPIRIFDSLAVAWTLRLVHWTRLFADAFAYRGSWQFGVAATGLHGHPSIQDEWGEGGPRYSRDEYRKSTTATNFEIEDRPRKVANRLIGQFARALGTYESAKPYLTYENTTD